MVVEPSLGGHFPRRSGIRRCLRRRSVRSTTSTTSRSGRGAVIMSGAKGLDDVVLAAEVIRRAAKRAVAFIWEKGEA